MALKIADRFRLSFLFLILALAQPQARGAQLFNATNSPASTQSTVHYLQQFTLSGPSETFIFTGFSSLGLARTQDDTARSQLVINFYVDLDLSPASPNPLAGATLIGNQVYGAYLSANPAVIGIEFDEPFVAPRTFAVEISLRSEDGSTYSDLFQSRFTLADPTLGTSPGYVWSDTDRDGKFVGADQTTFGASVANIRMTLVGVPGPRIDGIDFSNGRPRVTFTTVSGRNYRIERKEGLQSSSWTAVTGASSIPGSDAPKTIEDPDSATGARFYRVIMLP